MKWIKEHPYATGAIVIVGAVLLYAMRRAGGGSAGTGEAAQIAQLNASASIQQSQLAVQVQQTQAASQAQTAQVQAELQANEENAIAGIVGGAISGNQSIVMANNSATTNQQLIEAELEATQGQLGLSATENSNQMALALQVLENPNQSTAANELALVLNQGGIGSYNSMLSTTALGQDQLAMAKVRAEGSIFSQLLGGLFGL